jgi:hypothetical protein
MNIKYDLAKFISYLSIWLTFGFHCLINILVNNLLTSWMSGCLPPSIPSSRCMRTLRFPLTLQKSTEPLQMCKYTYVCSGLPVAASSAVSLDRTSWITALVPLSLLFLGSLKQLWRNWELKFSRRWLWPVFWVCKTVRGCIAEDGVEETADYLIFQYVIWLFFCFFPLERLFIQRLILK